jgi:hypothetical protein
MDMISSAEYHLIKQPYCKVDGLLFYFPTRAGLSTMPNVSSVIEADGDLGIYEDEAEEARKLACSVYWQDRLVPETEIKTLPFYPSAKSATQCDQEKIPVKWRDRVRGFLFFGWDFRHISNNKLKFKVDPNMDAWLNDKARFKNEIRSKPNHISEAFLR